MRSALLPLAFAVALPTFATPNARADDAAPVHLRGTLGAVAGGVLTLQPAAGGPLSIHLAPGFKVTVAEKASLADVTPGSYVGIANTGGDGQQDALEVHIFPEAQRGTGDGQRAWDGGGGGRGASRMTNGAVGTKVEAYDGQTLTVTYKGGTSAIMVRPNTPVVRLAPGTAADLKEGETVFVRDGHRASDGAFTADALVVGRGGAKPSM